jgi:hypothetical protein
MRGLNFSPQGQLLALPQQHPGCLAQTAAAVAAALLKRDRSRGHSNLSPAPQVLLLSRLLGLDHKLNTGHQ